jgi:hypothetical protein
MTIGMLAIRLCVVQISVFGSELSMITQTETSKPVLKGSSFGQPGPGGSAGPPFVTEDGDGQRLRGAAQRPSHAACAAT